MEKTNSNDTNIEVFNKQDLTISSDNVKRDLIPYWDRDYINQCIDNIKNHSHKMFAKFMWFTGVRITEVISIRKRDLNFKDFLITIRWLKNRKYHQRVIPMHPLLKDVLELFVAGLLSDDRVFSFTRQRGYQIIKKYFGGNPHKIRHSFAVNWLKCGGDIVMLSRILGHSKIQTTMEYLKIVPIDQGKELIKIQFV